MVNKYVKCSLVFTGDWHYPAGCRKRIVPLSYTIFWGQRRYPFRSTFKDAWYPCHTLLCNAASVLTVVNAPTFKHESQCTKAQSSGILNLSYTWGLEMGATTVPLKAGENSPPFTTFTLQNKKWSTSRALSLLFLLLLHISIIEPHPTQSIFSLTPLATVDPPKSYKVFVRVKALATVSSHYSPPSPTTIFVQS